MDDISIYSTNDGTNQMVVNKPMYWQITIIRLYTLMG